MALKYKITKRFAPNNDEPVFRTYTKRDCWYRFLLPWREIGSASSRILAESLIDQHCKVYPHKAYRLNETWIYYR